jgi:hypothetical protein
MRSFFLVLLLALAIPLAAAPKVADLAFLEGKWTLTDGDVIWDEQWTAPRGDSILGMCRAQNKGETFFYELLTIEQDESGPVMKLKHFRRGLIGREEKGEVVTLPLLSLKENEAVFEQADKQVRLTYRRKVDELYAALEKWKDGQKRVDEFRYVRVR